MDAHDIGIARSLEYHRLVAERLLDDEAVIERARERVQRWRRQHPSAAPLFDEWQQRLDGPREALRAFIIEQSEHGATMRSCSPFAGEIPPRERWKIWKEVGERLKNEAR